MRSTWNGFKEGPADPGQAAAFVAHGDELVKVLAHLKRQADAELPVSLAGLRPQDLVPFLERVEVALNAFGRMQEMTDPEGDRMTVTTTKGDEVNG